MSNTPFKREKNVTWACRRSNDATNTWDLSDIKVQVLQDIRDTLIARNELQVQANAIAREHLRVVSRTDRRLAMSGLKLTRRKKHAEV